MKIKDFQTESWSQKYKNSINCSHPRGFSQRAHCAGKKKHNESVEMEMVCEDCGMCQTHGNVNEIAKGQKDANGYTRCWPGKHAEGTKKGKNGGQVRNCVPNESQATRPIPVDDNGNRILPKQPGAEPRRPFGQPGDSKSSPKGVVTYTPTGLVHKSHHGDVTPRPQAVPEGSQRVDSLVTDALKLMRGPEVSDAVQALKTVLGDREFSSRRGHYNFFIRQMMDMYGQQGVAEGTGNVGASIRALCQKIYNAGDDEFEYFYNDSPIFAQYWDEYEGDIDSIIAEVDPKELQVILAELESYAQDAGLAEGKMSPMVKDSQKADRVRSLKNLIAIAREQGRQLRVQELELELKKLQGVAEDYNGEYDDEAGMAEGNLYTIAQAAQGLLDTIDDQDNLPEWAQEKIAKVEGMLVTVWNYLQSQKAQGIDPKVAEGEVKSFVIPDEQTQGNYENQGYRKNPQDRFAVIDYTFNKVILTTNDIKQAKQEAIEWAEYDDIPVAVKNQQTNKVVFKLNGYADAEKYLDESVDTEILEMYEAMQHLVTEMAQQSNISEDTVWETFESMDDNILYETAAWRRKEGKSKKGGLNAKGVASYRREHPGSKLQTAVTTKPSKLKPGSKAAKRRKSFCARMSGVKGPMKKPNGKPTRKALALRKWNC